MEFLNRMILFKNIIEEKGLCEPRPFFYESATQVMSII